MRGLNNEKRYALLDSLRGLLLLEMIVYHFFWDLVYLFEQDLPWFHSSLCFSIRLLLAFREKGCTACCAGFWGKCPGDGYNAHFCAGPGGYLWRFILSGVRYAAAEAA